jgi:hypothetical protein
MSLTYDKIWGVFMLHKHKSSDIIPAVPTVSGVIADGLVATVPAGHMLEKIWVAESGGAGITVDFGTSAGGNQIGLANMIPANDKQSFGFDYTKDGTPSGFSIYISKNGGGAWGATSLKIAFLTRKIV